MKRDERDQTLGEQRNEERLMAYDKDPRGPIRKIIKVELNPKGGLTAVTLSCGHVRGYNQIYHYRVGDDSRCFACLQEGDVK